MANSNPEDEAMAPPQCSSAASSTSTSSTSTSSSSSSSASSSSSSSGSSAVRNGKVPSKKTSDKRRSRHRDKKQAKLKSELAELQAQRQNSSDSSTCTKSNAETVWKYRAPPRGVGAEAYALCDNKLNQGACHLGEQCAAAHSQEELLEWRTRFQARVKQAAEELGRSFVDVVLERHRENKSPVLASSIPNVEVSCKAPLSITSQTKGDHLSWLFTVSNNDEQELTAGGGFALLNVGLLEASGDFKIDSVKCQYDGSLLRSGIETSAVLVRTSTPTDDCQEWAWPSDWGFQPHQACQQKVCYVVSVSFVAETFGTFKQSVVFNVGSEPYLVKELEVTVALTEEASSPSDSSDKEEDETVRNFKAELVSQKERWDTSNSTIVHLDAPGVIISQEDADLMTRYPPPKPQTFQMTQALRDPNLTASNYRERMHALLNVEEMAQFHHLAQFNVLTTIQLRREYLLATSSMSSSTAKFSRPGELFGQMCLGSSLSEDTQAGRLILKNCSTLLLTEKTDEESSNSRRTAYMAEIEDTGKNTLYLRLSKAIVDALGLVAGSSVELEVQFQLNRLPICEMHFAVDQLADLSLVYPDVSRPISIPWSPRRQWSASSPGSSGDGAAGEDDPKSPVPADDSTSPAKQLNPKQREALVAVSAPLATPLPPVLLVGPYGTGKTFTLGQAVLQLLTSAAALAGPVRVLVCTHSNSAADLYIRDYLHPFLEKQRAKKAAAAAPPFRLVRIYYKHRWVQTVHPDVQKYCLIREGLSGKVFRDPIREDVVDCQVIVATLSTCRYLHGLNLPADHFTHMLIDEAAQALESEVLMPLSLASPSGGTRLVLAGDHMQLSPEVFSEFAVTKRLNQSLLERLFYHYPPHFPCRILLCENYRSHAAILNFTSELFYNSHLVVAGGGAKKQPAHPFWHPMTMFVARGEDIQDENSTSFYNDAEVHEIVARVAELQRAWPKALWGDMKNGGIGIVTPYADQVQRLRAELRKRRLYGVSVERVRNVQGKQFRVIFLSTVRTRKSCINYNAADADESNAHFFGFLSDAKLVNTAVTRAQSLVAVVGDPLALTSIGSCRKIWERFLETAHRAGSLHGLRWHELRSMLDRVELRKSYVLNPYAREFVPRHGPEQYLFNLAKRRPPVPPEALGPPPPGVHPLIPPLPNGPPALGGPFSGPPLVPPNGVPPLAPPNGPSLGAAPNGGGGHPPGSPSAQQVPPSPPQIVPSLGGFQPKVFTYMTPSGVPQQQIVCLPPNLAHIPPHSLAALGPNMPALPWQPPFSGLPFMPRLLMIPPNAGPALAAAAVAAAGLPPGPVPWIPTPPGAQMNPHMANGNSNSSNRAPSEASAPRSLPPLPSSAGAAAAGTRMQYPPCQGPGPGPGPGAVAGGGNRLQTPGPPSWKIFDLVPQEEAELDSLLKSKVLQEAWANHLTVIRGPDGARLFKELVPSLIQNPQLVDLLRKELRLKKQQQAQKASQSTGQSTAILAEDLEALLLREGEDRKPNNQQQDGRNTNVWHQVRANPSRLNQFLTEDVGANAASAGGNTVPLYQRGPPPPGAVAAGQPPPGTAQLPQQSAPGAKAPSTAAAAPGNSENSPSSRMSYANALRASSLDPDSGRSGGSVIASSPDPLAHIRNLGTQGSRQLESEDRDSLFKSFGPF